MRDSSRGNGGQRPWASVFALVVLVLQTACATGAPGRGLLAAQGPTPSQAPGSEQVTVHDLGFLEPPSTPSRPIPIGQAEFALALARLAHGLKLEGTPRQFAHALLKVPPEPPEAPSMHMSGLWDAEFSRGQVHALIPVTQTGPVPLTPEAEEALRSKYLGWCESRGGGDCQGLLTDGAYLRADDRVTLALALALGPVLDETRAALGRELSPQALLASLTWAVGMYLALWLVPEPTTKALAATLTVILVSWLGLATVWGLLDGWAQLTTQAHEATTFAELRQAGARFAQVLGTDAARALLLAVTTLTGRTLGEVALRVRSLPGYALAGAQWEAQGGAALLQGVETVARGEALAIAVETVEAVAVSSQGASVAVLLKRGAGGGTGAAPGGGASTTVIRHRGGNQQVVLGNGQRWHLPRGKSLSDVPTQDTVGDQLQKAVTEAAGEWGPDKLTRNEQSAIDNALKKGKYWLARLLEREARGRFVEDRVYKQFETLYEWSRNKGVDLIDPATGYKYEILSGTESNMALHGRRMASEFFRMLIF